MFTRPRTLLGAIIVCLFGVPITEATTVPPPQPICEDAKPLTGAAATARNLKIIGKIYKAFGEGRVADILACITEDAAWESWSDNHAQRAGVPWLKAQRGRDGAAEFFTYVSGWQVNAFAVKNVMAAGDNVAAEIEVDFVVTQTGARLKDQEIHYWTLNERGMITGLRHYNDTAKHIAAAKGT
jgi:uncharacterized protein